MNENRRFQQDAVVGFICNGTNEVERSTLFHVLLPEQNCR